MSTVTTNLGMIKAEGSDIVNVVTHVANNFQILDNVFAANTPSTQAIGDAAAQGSALVVSRSDHKHAMPAFGTPVSVGSAISNGVSANIARADHVHDIGASLFGTIVALDGTLSDGSGSTAARANHKHSFAAGSFGAAVSLDGTLANGSNLTAARSDHKHDFAAGSFGAAVALDGTTANGTNLTAARSDHKHALAFGTAVTLDGTLSDGAATTAARADHKHSISLVYTAFTPTATQSGGLSVTVNVARYQIVGKFVHAYFKLTAGAAGTSGNDITVTLPAALTAAASAVTGQYAGIGIIDDIGTATYRAICWLASTTTVKFVATNNTGGSIGTTPAFAIASGDVIYANLHYEIA